MTKPKHTRDEYQLSRDYRHAQLDCDLVMKGGVSSGVFYPTAICKLAERYRFTNIGGASAGAIAAGVAAAAEYARHTNSANPNVGFAELEKLPRLLGADVNGETRLLSLFRPARDTQGVFGLFLTALERGPTWLRIVRIVQHVCRNAAALPLVGVVVGVAAVWTALAHGGPFAVAASLVCALLAFAACVAGAFALFGLTAYGAIARNFGGMCTGGEPDALCPWLEQLIDRAAGKAAGDSALTFGELDDKGVQLAMVTTNLTHSRPYRLPFADEEVFFFKRHELAKLFSDRIVRQLVAASRRDTRKVVRYVLDSPVNAGHDYVVLPPRSELPVIVAVRMSLSFPILLSAVPLYAVDWSSVPYPARDPANTSRPDARVPQHGEPLLERCWFSDGGICSNLPIHFFDALLPKKPTFALNLRAPHPKFAVQMPDAAGNYPSAEGELANVWIPENMQSGVAERWTRIPGDDLPPAQLLARMVDTMQNWNDNTLAKAPGYRDRILHISHTDEEGGLNLDMPADVIERLSERGAAAGFRIAERFDPAKEDGWQQQLWVRYRNSLAMLQKLLGTANERYFANDSGRDLIDQLVKHPPKPHKLDDAQRAAALEINARAFAAFTVGGANFEAGAPRPISELRVRPSSD